MIVADFVTVIYNDGALTITMTPPTSIANQTIRYREFVNMGGGNVVIPVSGSDFSGVMQVNLVEKWLGSGTTANQSGMTLLNGGVGIFRVNFPAGENSGREFGAYAYSVERTDSGVDSTLARGYRHLI